MFKSDFETDSPGLPAGGGSSSRGYRNTTNTGFIGRGNNGPGRSRNDSERRNDNQRRNHNQRQNDNRDREARRDYLQRIALTTLQILDDGKYFPPGQDGPYDLRTKILWTNENTKYYGPDAGEGKEILESEFVAASKPYDDDDNPNLIYQTRVQPTVPPPQNRANLHNTQTTIYVGEYSTLVGARKVYLALGRNPDPFVDKKIGVLNFASAKKPGGDFINGCQGQVRF